MLFLEILNIFTILDSKSNFFYKSGNSLCKLYLYITGTNLPLQCFLSDFLACLVVLCFWKYMFVGRCCQMTMAFPSFRQLNLQFHTLSKDF